MFFLHNCNNFLITNRYTLNIAGIENYETLQISIPHCWSDPAMGNVLRNELEPPAVQQAAFDDTVSTSFFILQIIFVLTDIPFT